MKKIFATIGFIGFLVPLCSFGQETPFSFGASADPTPGVTEFGAGVGGSSNTTCPKPQNILELFEFATCLMSYSVIPFLISLGLIMFLVGLVKFISAGDNEEKREGGRGLMIFGIIALFVMISVWGFVRILHNTFFDSDQRFETPTLPKRSTTPFK